MIGYAGDINETPPWFKVTAAQNFAWSIKHLLWDSEGVMPPGIPSAIDLDIIPHPRNIVPNILDGYRFAQIKFVAVLLEAAKKMDADRN